MVPCVSTVRRVQGIHMTAYSPLGSPDSAEMMKRQHKQSVMDNPTVKEVASKHNKAAAEVRTFHLKWTLCWKRRAVPALSKANCMASPVLVKVTPMHPQRGLCCMMVMAWRQQCWRDNGKLAGALQWKDIIKKLCATFRCCWRGAWSMAHQSSLRPPRSRT